MQVNNFKNEDKNGEKFAINVSKTIIKLSAKNQHVISSLTNTLSCCADDEIKLMSS